MLQHLDNVVDCRYIGFGGEALSEILTRLDSAIEVRNTFVLFGIKHTKAYSSDDFTKLKNKLQSSVTEKKRRWTDIFSQDVVSSPEMHDWVKGFNGKETDTEKPHERHTVMRLKGIYPALNFMIIRYAANSGASNAFEDREVIFGWGHHTEDPEGNAFVSRNKQLIATFERYWHILENDSITVHPHTIPIAPSEITGIWFRVSFYVDEDWKAENGIPRSQDGSLAEVYDLALVSIGIEGVRCLKVEGHRYLLKNNTPIIIHDSDFNAKAADLENFDLWFTTTGSSENLLNIAGWYHFMTEDDEQSFRVREFFGEFSYFGSPEERHLESNNARIMENNNSNTNIELKSFKNLKAGRLILFGFRVPVDPNSNPFEPHQANAYIYELPNSPREQGELVKNCLDWWERKGCEKWQGTSQRDAVAQASPDHHNGDHDGTAEDKSGILSLTPPPPPPAPPPSSSPGAW